MATTYGMLTMFDNDWDYVNTAGQEVVFDAINTILSRYNEEQYEMMKVFVGARGSIHKTRYYAPIGGEMQTMGRQAEAGAVKRHDYWDVAFPLVQIGDQLAGDRVDLGYMTAGQLEAQVKSIMQRDAASLRRSILTALFYNAQRTFDDPVWGDLNVEPLANDDAVTYPPVIGSATGATDDHYLTAANVANGMPDGYDDLIEHFGQMQSGDNVIVFANSSTVDDIADEADYTADVDRYLVPGDETALLASIPVAPGITTGRWNSVWVNEWDWIPADYLLFVHLDYDAPLYMREDPPETGLVTGLSLVAEDIEHPIHKWHYERRYGFGARNRLNGVVVHITGGAYTVPGDYDNFRYCASA